MQGCYAWNHRRQSWHTTSSVLLSFVLPSPWRQRKKKTLLCPRPETFSKSHAVLLHFFFLQHSWSLCNNFPTTAVVHWNAAAFTCRPYTAWALPMTKENCSVKCIQLCVLILFLLTYFHQNVQPWSNHDAAERADSQLTCMFVVRRLEQFDFFFFLLCSLQVSYDLKRNVEISQIYCSSLTQRSQREREKCFLQLEEAFKASLK